MEFSQGILKKIDFWIKTSSVFDSAAESDIGILTLAREVLVMAGVRKKIFVKKFSVSDRDDTTIHKLVILRGLPQRTYRLHF
jgi:hypothetical protein